MVQFLPLLVGTVIAFTACSRSVTGGYVDSPDMKYRVYGRCFGPTGPVNVVGWVKTIRITIVANDKDEAQLFMNEYHFRGAEVRWEAKWASNDDLAVTIFESSKSVESDNVKTNVPLKRKFRTLTYKFNPKTGVFTEQTK
jgi:hypothetical protein